MKWIIGKMDQISFKNIDGISDSLEPRNQETLKPRNQEPKKARNQEAKKPRTKKPRNQITFFIFK